ncbi:unnamed protein product [Durusdinium trenchii]|uniref:Major facilitator superfamily domain-containing protein 10 (Tetracycline transporter-like protein) n=2 Tax=Durusdinium trenchii TaxID=1381693 RepID=A0ABP0KSV7_9DINO
MEEAGKTGLQLLWSLGWIVPWTLMASIGTGMLLPMGNFLTLNFFAQRYTDLPPSEIKCQISTMSPYCQMALVDGNRLLTVLALVMPLCQFLTLPLVGLLSDAYGRKKALFVVFCLSNVALVFADLFIFFNVSFWFVIAWQPFMNTQVCTTVLNAACVDLLRPQDRAAGMGIISALDTIAYVIGLLLGYHLEMKQTYIVATFATLITGFVLVVFFPETLPPEKRSFQLSARNFVPWDSMPILWRTKTLRNLSIVTAIAAFMDSSTNRMMGTYYQRRMNWSAHDAYIFEFFWDMSMILWMTLFFSWIIWFVGEVGAMAFGRLMSTVYTLIAVGLVRPSQAFVNCAICAGPMTFALPAVAGLKSRLVGEEEQGRMQAAISTVFTVSGSIGSLLGGFMFEKLGNVDENGQFSRIFELGQAMVVVNLVGAFLSAFLFYDLFQRTRHFIGKPSSLEDGQSTRVAEEMSPEDSTYGSMSQHQ